jgi:hypothetical protein
MILPFTSLVLWSSRPLISYHSYHFAFYASVLSYTSLCFYLSCASVFYVPPSDSPSLCIIHLSLFLTFCSLFLYYFLLFTDLFMRLFVAVLLSTFWLSNFLRMLKELRN